MKTCFIILAGLLSFSTCVEAGIKCPDVSLIKENIDIFTATKTTDYKKGEITLESMTWTFNSNLKTADITDIKSLNTEISDIDEHTCNYLIYPTNSNMEDASLMLRAKSL